MPSFFFACLEFLEMVDLLKNYFVNYAVYNNFIQLLNK